MKVKVKNMNKPFTMPKNIDVIKDANGTYYYDISAYDKYNKELDKIPITNAFYWPYKPPTMWKFLYPYKAGLIRAHNGSIYGTKEFYDGSFFETTKRNALIFNSLIIAGVGTLIYRLKFKK